MIALTSVKNFTRPEAGSTDGRQIEKVINEMYEPAYHRWYDSSLVCGPVTSFFQLAMNRPDPQKGRHKTKVDTNMTVDGQFSPPYCCVLAQIGFQINAEPEVVDDFYSRCWFEFKVLGKILSEGRLWRFQRGEGYIDPETGEFQNKLPFHYRERPIGFGEQEPQPEIHQDRMMVRFSEGLPVPQAGVRPAPVYISGLTPFSLTVYAPDYRGPQLEVIAYLDGITDIPIC